MISTTISTYKIILLQEQKELELKNKNRKKQKNNCNYNYHLHPHPQYHNHQISIDFPSRHELPVERFKVNKPWPKNSRAARFTWVEALKIWHSHAFSIIIIHYHPFPLRKP